jgi:hypothetical protein
VSDRRVDQTNAGVEKTNARLDQVIGFLGAHHGNHEQRLQALEDQVFEKSG